MKNFNKWKRKGSKKKETKNTPRMEPRRLDPVPDDPFAVIDSFMSESVNLTTTDLQPYMKE